MNKNNQITGLIRIYHETYKRNLHFNIEHIDKYILNI